MKNQKQQRTAAAALMIVILAVPLLLLTAFFVDYGYLLFQKTELQRSADQAVLAAVRDLVPDSKGTQNVSKVKDTLMGYVKLNLGSQFAVVDGDIKIGRYDPATIYGDEISILDDGIFDTVSVTLRLDEAANSSVALYFARLFGSNESAVSITSTAVLQKAKFLGPGTSVFPFGIEEQAWEKIEQGETANIYGDGRIEDGLGNTVNGNWGTLDIGPRSNSTSDLSNQIREGLRQSDLDSLQQQGVIPTNTHIDGSQQVNLNGDPGLSAGLRHALEDVHGTTKIGPIFSRVSGKGGNVTYEVTGWTSFEVVDSDFNGSKNSRVEVRKAFAYDDNLRPVNDLSNTSDAIEGAFTSPVLVE